MTSLYTCIDWRRGAFNLDLELNIPTQGVTAIYGPSGSGKTTLLRCIAGLERPPLGIVRLGSTSWQSPTTWVAPEQRQVGYVFQEASLLPHLSVQQNLRYALKRSNTPASKIQQHTLYQLLGIEHLMDHAPLNLSGGEQQRVALATTLVGQPNLLLLDEPLSSLDDARKRDVLPFLKQLKQHNSTPMVYVSHSVNEVAQLADHLIMIDQGKKVAEGPISDTLQRIDLPLGSAHDVGAVLDGELVEKDATWGLSKVSLSGGTQHQLWLSDEQHDVGNAVRIRILARDVSLSLSKHSDMSILNILAGRIKAISSTTVLPKGVQLVSVALQDSQDTILAQLTTRSIEQLQLNTGLPVWVQIKSAALLNDSW